MSRDVFWFIHGEDAGVLLAAATGSAVVLTGKGLRDGSCLKLGLCGYQQRAVVMEKSWEGLLVCVIGAPLNGEVCL